MTNGQQRVIIENVQPQVEHGAFPAKRVIHDTVKITADIICDSHDVLSAEILYKYKEEKSWTSTPLRQRINDAWEGSVGLPKTGSCFFTIRAWVNPFATWYRDILKKIDASVDYGVDLLVGAEIISEIIEANPEMPSTDKEAAIDAIKAFRNDKAAPENRIEYLISGRLQEIMDRYPHRHYPSRYDKELEIQVERPRANFSSWYEFFPRSLGKDAKTHGTFKDCEAFLPYVADMGFDVVYLPPIHPIGKTNRKGKNNSVTAKAGEPGSPWAIGADGQGHKDIHPELGTLKDFKSLLDRAKTHGIEIAMDIAFQCSPDHPYVSDHPEWFKVRPDGSLQ